MIATSRWAVLALLVAGAACEGSSSVGSTTSPTNATGTGSLVQVELVSGTGQAGLPGVRLPGLLVVRATRSGRPAEEEEIRFAPSAGDLDRDVVITGSDGLATVQWTLPPENTFTAASVTAWATSRGRQDAVVFTARRASMADLDLVRMEGSGRLNVMVYDARKFTLEQLVRSSGADSAHLPNFASTELWDELVAFTPGRAPVLVTPTWTPRRDTVTVRFPGVVRLPMTIWVVKAPFDSTYQLVQRHIEGVRLSLEANAGVGLGDVRIVDATGFPAAADYQADIIACELASYNPIGRDEGRLNAYYLGNATTKGIVPSAAYCENGMMEIYPLAWDRWPTVLAHEIGHGMLGGYHETVPDNLMHFRGNGYGLTQGQLYRAHFSESSILNSSMFQVYPQAQQRRCDSPHPNRNPPDGCPPRDFVLEY